MELREILEFGQTVAVVFTFI